MLDKILEQEKEELLKLMFKNELAEMWLDKKISEIPNEIRELDAEEANIYQQKEWDKYIMLMEKLDNILSAKEDNIFNLDNLNEALTIVKKYV